MAGPPRGLLTLLPVFSMAAVHANTLFIQVYGDGLALHRSALVPRPDLVEPGFDPLALAVVEGHRRGIEVHAWMNVCNTWSGGLGTPASPTHLVRLHPEWEGFRDYSLQVAAKIAGRYAVDGIHLDYLQFPGRRSALLGFLFPGQGAPACPDAAGKDDPGELDITGSVFLLNHLFVGGRAPPAPFPAPGTDPTAGGLAECRG